MNRTILALLAGAVACSLAAGRFEPFVATGVWVGFVAGSGIGLFNVLWQRHQVRVRPEALMGAMVFGFLIKLAGALAGALVLRFVDPLPELADWRGFLVAYATAAFLTLLSGSFDNARVLLNKSAL